MALNPVDDIFRVPTVAETEHQWRPRFSAKQTSEAWIEAAQTVKTYHDALIAQWKAEMDNHLLFAGLLSAALTSFNVQSYQLLQPSPTALNSALLQQIVVQLNSFTSTPPFINSTQFERPLSDADIQDTFRAPSSAVWINALWFLSLVCSFASASISLLVKQWLLEQTVGLSGTSRESARIRQHRLNMLLQSHVGTIVLVLPITLQLALVLFLAGLVILLWTLHKTVAAITSSFVGILFVYLIVATVLPVFQRECCYRSPQALAVYTIVRLIRNNVKRFATRLLDTVWHQTLRSESTIVDKLNEIVWSCKGWWEKPTYVPTWSGRDQLHVATSSGSLDRTTSTMAYTTTLSSRHLENLSVILRDIPPLQLGECFRDIHEAWYRQWGENSDTNSKAIKSRYLVPSLIQAMGHVLEAYPEGTDAEVKEWDDVACAILEFMRPFFSPSHINHDNGSLGLMCQLAMKDTFSSIVALEAIEECCFAISLLPARDGVSSPQTLPSILATCRAIMDEALSPGNITLARVERHFKAVIIVTYCFELSLRYNGPTSLELSERISTEGREVLCSCPGRLRTQDWTHLIINPAGPGGVANPDPSRRQALQTLLNVFKEHVSLRVDTLLNCATEQGWGLIGFLEDLKRWNADFSPLQT